MLRIRLFVVLATCAIVAACNSLGSSSLPMDASKASVVPFATATPTPTPPPHHHGIQYSVPAIDMMGEKIKAALDEVEMSSHHYRATGTKGPIVACHDRVELYSPDKNGDPNSTETIDFYDAGCKIVERDRVRTFAMRGAHAELVTGSVRFYDRNGNLVSTRDETHRIKDAVFDKYGYADLSKGFIRETRGHLTIAGRQSDAKWDDEFIAFDLPVDTTGPVFCTDSAGFEDGADPAKPAYGWQGRTDPSKDSTIVDNGDGTMTYSTWHEGDNFKSAHDGLTVVAGAPNRKCPIRHPAFTLAGGSGGADYRLPFEASFDSFHLVKLRINGATIGPGWHLNAADAMENGVLVVKGTIDERGTRTATFEIDRLGMGTIAFSNGATLSVIDWAVVR